MTTAATFPTIAPAPDEHFAGANAPVDPLDFGAVDIPLLATRMMSLVEQVTEKRDARAAALERLDVTDQALRLLTAWTADDASEADEFLIERAVGVVLEVRRCVDAAFAAKEAKKEP
jgi:hypothetical protein